MPDTVIVQDQGTVIKVVAGGPRGPAGPPGPGILSNADRLTVSDTPPTSPEVNDLWVDTSS